VDVLSDRDPEVAGAPHPEVVLMDPRLHQPTVAACAQSIRELGEMLAVADRHPDLRARLEEVERLNERVRDRVAAIRNLISAEYAEVMGG
jgi:hypothetical protein